MGGKRFVVKQTKGIGSFIGLFLAQSFITIGFLLFGSLLYLFLGFVYGSLILFPGYAVIWWFIWRFMLPNYETPRFYFNLLFATLPLLFLMLAFIYRHPTPNYTLMIPLLPQDIYIEFSTLVSGMVLFPLYSILLYQVIFPETCLMPRLLKSCISLAGLIGIGAGIFALSFHYLPGNW